MPKASDRIVEFCLTRLRDEPLRIRARLYRDLAQFSASNAERKSLLTLAAECRAIELHHRQLVLDFKRGAL